MAAVVVRRRLALAGAPLLPTYRQLAAAAIPIPIPKVNEDEHSGAFLRWLRSKAGSGISSVLRIGTSPLGRSLFASQPIQEGDCILQLPHTAQLTQDKLPREVRLLLDDDAAVAGDTAAKVAVLLMMEQRLGHESGWAPYVTSLPAKDQMHNMMFWDLDELDMVRHSPVYDEAIKQKEQVRKQFSAAKPALEHFPHLFEEIKLEDFMHSSALVSSRAWQTSRGVSLVPFADFLNHDGASDSILVYDEEKAVSEVIADRNYAVGEQVMIRYGKYSNAMLALNFGFTLSRNIYDQAHIWIDMSEQDPLYKKKLDIWEKHRTPKSQHMCSSGCARTSFAIKEVKCSGNKGVGIPQALRAFVRIFCATSIEELEEMTVEAAENDGRLARRPLKHAEGEVHAHRKLLLHLDNMIQGHSTAIEQLETIDGAASRSMHPFRKEMAKNLLAGELQILQSAYAWVANYCKTVACT
ncbi:fructose-bisphosphate aldolase-lysine N-methyltransferase, chloroplastic-like isoform X1 [Triticum dicoccoides]|uniref:fructose-bisphosphate aldolase-lysine N-methyltransferase, chloroplastic-like isoform X1 n=1 Tax=Triticum dicoccoides TaxID=85692 RepID=UPI0018909382|nr:fructose-bisphosphate aldolase-lysine N-methyltransferase, chloroplastic-like isoform X1 [Triticum dicoccoides]